MPSAAGTVPVSCSGASVDAEVSVAVKPALVVEESELMRTVSALPVDVTVGGIEVLEKFPSNGAVVDAPSYSLA